MFNNESLIDYILIFNVNLMDYILIFNNVNLMKYI